jgi:hypothetical protein
MERVQEVFNELNKLYFHLPWIKVEFKRALAPKGNGTIGKFCPSEKKSPVIYLSASMTDEEEWSRILLHEMVHYQLWYRQCRIGKSLLSNPNKSKKLHGHNSAFWQIYNRIVAEEEKRKGIPPSIDWTQVGVSTESNLPLIRTDDGVSGVRS